MGREGEMWVKRGKAREGQRTEKGGEGVREREVEGEGGVKKRVVLGGGE